MPHHWTPILGDDEVPAGRATRQYAGKDKHEQTWELWKISDEEAKELEGKPKKHDCERVLYDLPKLD